MAKSLRDLYEMPRPKGTLSAPIRGALEMAKRYGRPFTAVEFAQWVGQSGGKNVNPTSLSTLLRRMAVDNRRELNNFTPLIWVNKGRPGRSSGGGSNPSSWQYAYKGTAGVAAGGGDDLGSSVPLNKAPKGAQAPAQQHDPDDEGEFSSEDDLDFLDVEPDAEPEDEPATSDDDDEDLGPGWTKLDDPNGKAPAAAPEPASDDDDDLGPGWRKVDDEPEDQGHEPDLGEPGSEDWIPQPRSEFDNETQSWPSRDEEAMDRLDQREFGPDHEIWREVAKAKNGVTAHLLIKRSGIPPTLQNAAIVVARKIFDNLGKDWDGDGPSKREGRSLRSLYRL